MGERPSGPGGHLPAHRRRRPERARHDPGRRRRAQAAADPLQPDATAPQPWPQDRPQAGAHPAARLGNTAPGVTPGRTGRAVDRPGRRLHPDPHARLHRPAVGRGHRPGARLPPPRPDPGRMADPRGRRQVLPDPAQGRLLPQPRLGARPAGRSPAVSGRPARQAGPELPAAAVRLYRGARRQRPVPVPLPRRQASPAEQLRPPGVPPRLRRAERACQRPARPGSSPSTPPPGPASRSPPGQPRPRAAQDGARRSGTFRHAGAGSGSSRMAFRWPPGSRWFPA